MSTPALRATTSLHQPLAAFKARWGLDDAELARWLGTTPAGLARLDDYPLPASFSRSYTVQCVCIADAVGCDVWALRHALGRY